jgi:hypothetical protein
MPGPVLHRPIIRRGRYKYAVVMPGKSYAQDLCDVELTVAMLRLVFRAPDGRFSAIELPTPTYARPARSCSLIL